MAKINEWFEKKDYELGLALLMKHSKNRALIQNLHRKKNPGKLEYELRRIAGVKKEVKKEVVPEKQVLPQIPTDLQGNVVIPTDLQGNVVIIGGKREVSIDDLPPELKKKWEENRDAYKEIRATHEKLKLMEKATPEDRKPLVERMTVLDNRIRANWEAIDAWDGKPAKPPAPPVPIDHKRINANRKYISTNLKRLNELEGEKAVVLRNNIQLRYDELKGAKQEVSTETIEELKKAGIII